MLSKVAATFALALSLVAPAGVAATQFEIGTLAVEQRGEGPAVIFIPGLASGAWTWDGVAAALEGEYALYLVTLPGFDGREPRSDVTLDSLQEELRSLIEARQLDKPILVGHSLGGTLSLAFATRHSSLISGVIAVDGLPVFPGTEAVAGDRTALAQRIRAQFANQSGEQFAAAQLMYMKQVGSIDEATAAMLAERTSRSDPTMTGELAAQVMALDLRPRLTDITVPVVEISPFYAPDLARINIDEAGKTEYYRMLLSGVKDLEVVSISPSRHFVMFDQAGKFVAAVERALDGLRK